MTIKNPIINSFKYGELSPTFAGRFDLEAYQRGVDTYKNFITRMSGGGVFRPGTIHVAAAEDDGYSTRLVSFVRDSGTKCVLEFGDEKVRIFKDHAHVTDLTATWDSGDVFTIHKTQINDKLYCFHGDYPPQIITSAAGVTWTVSAMVISGSAGATFTAAGNYPICGAFYSERMYFGGTKNAYQDIWGSKVGDVSDFVLGATDAAAFSFTVAARDNRQIQWMESHHAGLMVGTLLGEGLLMDNADNYITPTLPQKFRWVSEFGSAALPGISFDGRVLFIQDGLRILREFYPQINAYDSPALSFMAEHLLYDCVDIAISREPWPIVWIVKSDGTMAALSRSRETGVTAWSDIVTDGNIDSVAVIPGDEEDEVWISTSRTIGGNTKRFIEYFKPILCTDQKKNYHVDCGVFEDNLSDSIADIVVQTPVAITAITRANPAVVTASGHSFSNGDKGYIDDVGGMAEVNERLFDITGVSGDSFELKSEDSTLYTTYTSGGEIVKSPDIYIECSTSLATLAWTDGDYIRFSDIVGTTELNHKEYAITNVGTVTFEVRTGTIIHHTTWTSGGTLEKVVATVGSLAHLSSEVVAVTADGAFHTSQTVDVSEVTLDGRYNKISVGLQYDGEIKTMNLNPLMRASKASEVWLRLYNTLGLEAGVSEDSTEDLIFTIGSDIAAEASWYTGDYVHYLDSDITTETHLVIKQTKSLPATILAIGTREGIYGE